MKRSIDVIFKRPTGEKKMVVFYYDKESLSDLVIGIYDSLERIKAHELTMDLVKSSGQYAIYTNGLKDAGLESETLYYQNVDGDISYEGMFDSLITATISCIVGKIHDKQKGERRGSEETGRNDEEPGCRDGESTDGVQCTPATEERLFADVGEEGRSPSGKDE